MSEKGGRTGMIITIVVLLAALIAVFVLWQRDQESKDLEVDVGLGGAEALVEPAPATARRADGGLRLELG